MTGRFAEIQRHFTHQSDLAYLNTGALGLSPRAVLDEIKQALDECEEKGGPGQHDDRWTAVKTQAAHLLNCTASDIAFTRNTTEGANIVCNGLPFSSGDEIITTSHEHVGNTITWLARADRDNLAIKVFDPAPTTAESLARIEALHTPKTRALSIPHLSCASGQILPVEAIGAWAQDRGLWYFVDGSQALGMTPVDVRAIQCHAYATSGHKWLLGPKGTGFLYVREDALDLIRATSVGAYSNEGPFDLRTGAYQFHPSAQRYEYGTLNGPLIAGLGAAFTFLADLDLNHIHHHDLPLANQLREGLYQLDADVLSPDTPATRSAIITFRLPNLPYQELQSFMIQKHRLRVRGIYEGGLNAIRVSLHLYNTVEEVERVLEAVEAAKKM